MSQKLFVGNIPYDLSETDLKSIFEDGGLQVSEVKIITDKFTGKSRGFGFVSFDSDADAESAINAMNGKQVGGRMLKIAVAKRKEREDRPQRGPGRPRQERRYSEEGPTSERSPDDEGEGNF
jgi:RNA recognition motif-containing protein